MKPSDLKFRHYLGVAVLAISASCIPQAKAAFGLDFMPATASDFAGAKPTFAGISPNVIRLSEPTQFGLDIVPESLNDTNSSFACNPDSYSIPDVQGAPQEYLDAIACASAIFDVPVAALYGLGKIECNNGLGDPDGDGPGETCLDVGTSNYAQAAGPAQTQACVGNNAYKDPNDSKCWEKGSNSPAGKWTKELMAPPASQGMIGYGIDCDGDNKYNPWDYDDAMCTAGNQLRELIKNSNGDLMVAFKKYNGGPVLASKGSKRDVQTARYAENCLAEGTKFIAEVGLVQGI